MPKKREDLQEWLSAGFKALIVSVVSMGVFVFNNLNKNVETSFGALNDNIKNLTSQLKAMEDHQVETDKRVSAIEVAREINTAGYQKLLSDVQEMKINLALVQNTITAFLSKKSK